MAQNGAARHQSQDARPEKEEKNEGQIKAIVAEPNERIGLIHATDEITEVCRHAAIARTLAGIYFQSFAHVPHNREWAARRAQCLR